MMDAETIIEGLSLAPLNIEGGHFRETYRSPTTADPETGRCCGTLIYYLLRGTEKSNWHRVASDEIWLYHAGSPAIQLLLFPDGSWEERVVGSNFSRGQNPQSLIPAGTWQASVLQDQSDASWGLFGAAVIPGFEYEDFTAGSGLELLQGYPEAADRMRQLGLAE